MQSLYTSASGLQGQQTRLDVIANNLANSDTTGYKSQDVQFKDMLYATLGQRADASSIAGRLTQSGLRMGSGVLPTNLLQLFTQGTVTQTGNPLDVAIQGDGFFTVQDTDPNGNTQTAYTRDGSFKIGLDAQGAPLLTTANGRAVLDVNGNPIDLSGADVSTLQMDGQGNLTAKVNGTKTQIAQLALVHVDQPQANLAAVGQNLFVLRPQAVGQNLTSDAYTYPGGAATVKQGSLEQSNVDMTEQMTEMIMAQRAYSMNARALSTTDQMMSLANNLRRG